MQNQEEEKKEVGNHCGDKTGFVCVGMNMCISADTLMEGAFFFPPLTSSPPLHASVHPSVASRQVRRC